MSWDGEAEITGEEILATSGKSAEAYLKQFHTDSDSTQELAKLKEIRDDLMRQAELAAHNYCGALGMEDMREREAAFEIKENLHRAGAVY
jgi:hypothetical protein